ncbi:MAG: autotransporter outer membrane beta-barrel domain-containing protein [Phascolarctobacterium sp.]|nr:autotransporter outer membrane beta-barrel domain-containing protein [Phascolarctobacterium sp.]
MSNSVVWAEAPSGWKEVMICTHYGYDDYYVPEYGNNVTINSGEYTSDSVFNLKLAAIATESDLVENGSIVIDGDVVAESVLGGVSNEGNVKNNQVIMSGNASVWSLTGGSSYRGNAENNKVVVNYGTIDGNVNGGRVGWEGGTGYANNNIVIINNGTIGGMVTGGRSLQGNAENNEVYINGGTIAEVVVGGGGDGDVRNNKVVINGGVLDNNIEGGSAQEDGLCENNVVTINGGHIKGNVLNFSWHNVATKNTIVMTAGVVDGKIVGGWSEDGNVYNNTVTVIGGTCKNIVAGGWITYDGNISSNVINIGGSADITGAELFGGVYDYRNNYPKYDNNTLNIGWNGKFNAVWNGMASGKVKSIAGFDTINFKALEWSDGSTVVKVNDLFLNPESSTVINVDEVYDKDGSIDSGEQMKLIESTSAIDGNFSSNDTSVKVYKGAFLVDNDVASEVTKEDNSIILTIKEDVLYNANAQALIIGESRAAATAFTNQGSELVETGLDALARDNNKDTKVFAALYGNASEYETGSHIKVNGFSGIVGVGKTNANGLTIGAFFENGEGNYRTYNIVDGDFMRGDGEANYNGGGFIVRKDNVNGVYTEASLRAGNLQNELRNAVRGSEGLTGYDIDTFYYGAHVGVGKVIPRGNEGDSIDVYGKFIYTHHDSEDFTIDGDDFHFDSVDSERLRLGFRINEVQNDKLDMYYGAAWEYEFNGDANNTVVGYDLATPSLEGSTVIGELGAHYKANEKWSFDLNARAYAGQRDGFGGSLQANYNF